MSSDMMFDNIIMNIFRNKALECHVKLVYSYLKKQRTTKFIFMGGHFKTFTERKALVKVLMLYDQISMFKKNEDIFI